MSFRKLESSEEFLGLPFTDHPWMLARHETELNIDSTLLGAHRRKISHSSSPDEEKGGSEKLSSLPKVSELVTAAEPGF